MGERALKLVERKLASNLRLQAPTVRQVFAAPLLYADTPAETRLSVRLFDWLAERSVGHRPAPVKLKIEQLGLISGQELQAQLAGRGLIYDEHSLLMRLLSHDVQETGNNDPNSPGFVLSTTGAPNLLPVAENLAINICRVNHCRHDPPHWDCDLILIDDRQGKWVQPRVITIARRY